MSVVLYVQNVLRGTGGWLYDALFGELPPLPPKVVMSPRGVKKLLKSTAPVKLTGSGRYKGFEVIKQGKRSGIKLKGLTKRLDSNVFSGGTFPSIALRGTEHRHGWRGAGGGRKRGVAVDAQLSRAINSGKVTPQKGQYSLTKLALIALHEHGLEPVMAQRGCCSEQCKIATAADVICYEPSNSRLVVIELKCGHSGSKTAPALSGGKHCYMDGPCSSAYDNTLNRHLAQLAVTRELFANESNTVTKLNDLGIDSVVGAALLYVNEESCELFSLPKWWSDRAPRILQSLR